MKVQHDDVVRTSLSCLYSSSKRFRYDARIDNDYYGKSISLREKLLLKQLFGAAYDDITQMLPGSNAKRKSSENLRLTEETIKVAKTRLISHALKIVSIDKPVDSKMLSDCCSSTITLSEHDQRLHRNGVYTSRQLSGCRVVNAKRVEKRQVKRIWSDISTYKFNDLKEKDWRTDAKLDINYVTVFDHPCKYKKSDENNTESLVDEITNENFTTLKISTPISRAYKIETGNTPLKNVKNGRNESILKQSPPITHRPPYNFMANPRISLNNCEPNIKHRFDKDATGDSNCETVTSLQPIIKRNDEKYHTNLIRLALIRCFCMLTLKPQLNQLDVTTASTTVAKSLRLIIRTTLNSQLNSKSVSERSKIIKKTNKKNIAKVRYGFRKNFNIIKENTNNNIPKLEAHLNSYLNLTGRVSKDLSENNLDFGIRGYNHLAREVRKKKLNINVFCAENPPQMCMNLERQSLRLKKTIKPFAKFHFDPIDEAQEMKKLSEEFNLSYKFSSHCSLNCKPEIETICQNIIDKKPQVQSYEWKPIFDGCILHESLLSRNQNEPNEQQTNYCKKLANRRSEPKSTCITHKSIKHIKTANLQTNLKSQINNIIIHSKLNRAVQVNSSFGFAMDFYKKTSPLLQAAHICQCSRQCREAGIETHREGEGSCGNHGQILERDNSYAKNFCIESDAQSCFCTSKLHKMSRNKLNTTSRKVRYLEKGIFSKEIQLSCHQDNIMRKDFGFLTDIPCERPIPCAFNKEKMDTDFTINSKQIIQRTTSTQTFPSQLINKSRQIMIRSYQAADSEIMNTEFSLNRKITHTSVPNGNPRLIHDLSNKYRYGYSPVELYCVKCETSLSSFSSIIGFTTTTSDTSDSSDSNQSFPSAKYNKYKQNTTHRLESIYKSSFYALNINVKNTNTDKRETKLERKKRLAEAKNHRVKFNTNQNRRHSQAVRIGSNFSFDVEFSKSAVHARDFVSEKNQDRGEGPAPDVISERKKDKGAASIHTLPNKSVDQGTHTVKNKKHLTAESQSDADTQHIGVNTNRCFCTLKLQKMGRVYREKGVAAKLSQPKPNVLKESGTVTTKKQVQKNAVVEVDLEPNEGEPGEEYNKRLKKKTKAVEAHISPDQKNDIPSIMAADKKKEKSHTVAPEQKKKNSSKQVCRITSNFSFNVEFVKYPPDEEIIQHFDDKPKGFNFIKGLFYPKKSNNKCRSILEMLLACCRKKDLNKQNQNSNKSVQSNTKYRPDNSKKVKEVGQNSKTEIDTDIKSKNIKERTTTTHTKKDRKVNKAVKYRLEDLDPYECEPGTCIPGECDPNVCFEIIKKRGTATSMGTDIEPKPTNEGTTTNDKKKDKKRKTANEVVKYRLEDLDPYECEPGTCIPGKCDPIVCFEIIKKRGLGTSMGTDITSKNKKARTTPTKTKKDKKPKKINEVVKYRLEDLDPYECEPGTCIPGECDPNVCFEIIKKRGMGTSIGTDVEPKLSNEGTTTNKKDKTRKTVKAKGVGDSGSQGTRSLTDPDSQLIPNKKGAILKRCFCTAKLQGIEIPLAPPKSKKVKQKETKKIQTKTNVEELSQSSQTIKPAHKSKLLNLKPYECEPGVCVPGKCDPKICYERIQRRKGIKDIATQSNHDNKSVKTGKQTAAKLSTDNSKTVKAGKPTADVASQTIEAGKHTADLNRKSDKAGKRKSAMGETKKLQDGDHPSKNLSKSFVRIGSNFSFNIGFSKQISGMGGDGPDNKKLNMKRKMVSGSEVPANPKTKKQKMVTQVHTDPKANPKKQNTKAETEVTAKPKTKKEKTVPATEVIVPAKPKAKSKGTGKPAQNQESQVVQSETKDQSSGVGIMLKRCFCTLSLHKRSKKLKATENNTKKVKKK